MFTRTIEYNGAVLTIGRENVRSRLLRGMVYRHFDLTEDYDPIEFMLIQGFVKFMTQVKVDGEIGFVVPSIQAEKDEMLAGYVAFLDMPADFFDAYNSALAEVDAIVGDPDLTPDESGKKKAAKS